MSVGYQDAGWSTGQVPSVGATAAQRACQVLALRRFGGRAFRCRHGGHAGQEQRFSGQLPEHLRGDGEARQVLRARRAPPDRHAVEAAGQRSSRGRVVGSGAGCRERSVRHAVPVRDRVPARGPVVVPRSSSPTVLQVRAVGRAKASCQGPPRGGLFFYIMNFAVSRISYVYFIVVVVFNTATTMPKANVFYKKYIYFESLLFINLE